MTRLQSADTVRPRVRSRRSVRRERRGSAVPTSRAAVTYRATAGDAVGPRSAASSARSLRLRVPGARLAASWRYSSRSERWALADAKRASAQRPKSGGTRPVMRMTRRLASIRGVVRRVPYRRRRSHSDFLEGRERSVFHSQVSRTGAKLRRTPPHAGEHPSGSPEFWGVRSQNPRYQWVEGAIPSRLTIRSEGGAAPRFVVQEERSRASRQWRPWGTTDAGKRFVAWGARYSPSSGSPRLVEL